MTCRYRTEISWFQRDPLLQLYNIWKTKFSRGQISYQQSQRKNTARVVQKLINWTKERLMWTTERVLKKTLGSIWDPFSCSKNAHKSVHHIHPNLFSITFSNIISSILTLNPRERRKDTLNSKLTHQYHYQILFCPKKSHTTTSNEQIVCNLTPTTLLTLNSWVLL